MALEKMEIVDKVEIVNSMEGYQNIQVRTRTVIVDTETGEQMGAKFHRHVVTPDHDCTNECDLVKGIAEKVHTPEAKAKYQEKMAAQAVENAPV